MAMAGVDRWLSAAEIEAICQHYTAPKTASMDIMHYTQFLADVDEIFTKPVSPKPTLWATACGLWAWPCLQLGVQLQLQARLWP
jgi:hypothetical protein